MPPVALIALAFAGGVALHEATAPPEPLALAATALAALALIVAAFRRTGIGVAAMAMALALGLLAAAAARPVSPPDLLDGQPWDVTARIEEPPERAFGRARALVGLETVTRDGIERAASGRVQLAFAGEPVEPLLPGDRVRFRARLSRPRGFAEPDSPDPERAYAIRGVIAVAGVGEPAAIARLVPVEKPRAASSVMRAIAGLRLRLVAWVAARLDGDRRALIESLVLGERGEIARDLDEAFRIAGVSHVLSVSGLHLAAAGFLLFVGLRLLLLRVTPLARRVAVARIAAVAALPATAFYTLLTGAAVATVRSCVVAWIYLGGVALGRAPVAAAALGLAALGILGASPLALYDPSFQLSFAAALGCALLAPPAMRRLRRGWLDGTGLAPRLARGALGLVVTSASAIAATAPITAWHFGRIAPAGLVANVIVVPLAELVVLPVGLGACALSTAPLRLADGAATLLLELAGLGAGAMAAIVRWFASWAPPGRVPAPTLLQAALWYALLAALLATAHGRLRRSRPVIGALVLALVASAAARALEPRLFPSLTLSFLDVGQGDSCFVELPDGRTLLVDGGGSIDPAFDPGEMLLVPWLERHGVRRIDVVVLTHPHPDHANGLATVVERLPVGEVWTNGAASSLPGLVRLEAAAARHGVPVVRSHALDGPARIEVLHPLVDGMVRAPPPSWSENDGSIVLRIRYGEHGALLTGDVEARAEARLTRAPEDAARLAADVVKAPHHGSRTSSTPPLVAAAGARVVVFPVGAGNRWGFPAPEVVARWREAGARTYRTDEDGAVTVRMDRDGHIDVRGARRR